MANVAGRDLNLLHLFQVLYEERNVSRAADRLTLSQPALSHRLARLRQEFGDPLFVRAARGLTATPHAHALAPQVQRLLAELETFYDVCDGRDFLAKAERIHLYTTDYIEQLLLPRLLPLIREQAPNLQIVTHNTRGRLPREELENGTCDMAIAGFFEGLPDTFYQQHIHEEDFVVLASRGNVHASHGLNLDGYLACDHVVTTLTGDLDGLVDKALRGMGLSRRVAAGLSSFLTPPLLVAGSDLLLTCLRSVGEHACQHLPDLSLHPCPLPLRRVEVIQTWHQRTHDDRLRSWLRQQIRAVAQGSVESRASA